MDAGRLRRGRHGSSQAVGMHRSKLIGTKVFGLNRHLLHYTEFSVNYTFGFFFSCSILLYSPLS